MATETPQQVIAEEEAHVEGLDGTGKDMSRIISMSDAVFAFSMTFLVITIVLPQVGATSKYPSLTDYLQGEWPAFVTYLLSFFIITSWWAGHRRIFSPIVRYDSFLIRLNNLFLLVIAMTPFLVTILYTYGPGSNVVNTNFSSELAVAMFSGVQALGGLLLLGIWHHSTQNHRLVEPHLSLGWIRYTEQSEIFTVLVFAVAVPVAFLSPLVAEVMWILMIVGGRHFSRIRRPTPHRPAPTRTGTTESPPLS